MTELSVLSPGSSAAAGSVAWNGETAAASLRRFVEKGALAPMRTILPSADMVDEAAVLAQLGFQVIVVDPREDAIRALARRAREAKLSIDVHRGNFLSLSPTLFGAVELIVDRTFFHSLPPLQRPAWADRAGRILPVDGHVAGLFLVKREGHGPPYPVTRQDLARTVGRLFSLEVLEEIPGSLPGRPQVYRGLFRHR